MGNVKNNSGFTLLEILTAVAILALLMTIAITGYNKVVEKSKKQYYQKQEELMIQAGREYFNDNHNQLPRAEGESKCVILNTLISNKYIDKIQTYKKRDCNGVDSKVCAIKLNKTKYLYIGELNCFVDYKSPEYKTPVIETDPKEEDSITMELNETKNIKAVIKYNSDEEKEETDIASYRYVIYKKVSENNYESYYDSGWKEITESTKKKTINIKLNSTGTFYAKIWAYNIKGKSVVAKSGEVTLNMNLACKLGESIKITTNPANIIEEKNGQIKM